MGTLSVMEGLVDVAGYIRFQGNWLMLQAIYVSKVIG